MRPDLSFLGPPKRNVRVTASEARFDEALILIAGDMFAAGYDTRDIAIRLVTPEAAVYAALRVARERQRGGAFMDKNEGARHMAKKLSRVINAGRLFAGLTDA